MAYFTSGEIDSFFHREDPDDYLRVLNVAHDLPAGAALDAVRELLDYATSDDDIALIAACVLEPVAGLRYRELGSRLVSALEASAKLRQAWRGVLTSQMPTDVRSRLDAVAREPNGGHG